MTIFTNKIFPAGGEAGDGGGIVQVRNFHRSGPLSFSQGSSSSYNCLLYSEITPRDSSNKILIMGSIDGVAYRSGSGEWEAWLGYNALASNGTTITANDQGVGSWTNLCPVTGLGAWNNASQTIGSYNFHVLHSPGSTSLQRYELINNTRSGVFINNEWNTNPDAGGSDQGTSIILMEISS